MERLGFPTITTSLSKKNKKKFISTFPWMMSMGKGRKFYREMKMMFFFWYGDSK